MIKRILLFVLVIFICFSLASKAFAFEFFKPWGYVWINGANYKTNLERDDFNSQLGRVETKIGVSLWPLWRGASIQPYFAYYGVASADKHSWNNNNVSGIGVQVMPLLGFNELDWLQDLKVFWETLSVQWMSEDESDPDDNPEYNYTTDSRIGLDIWHEWNQPGPYKVENRRMLWGELWARLSYRSTNFGCDKFDNWLFTFQPKVGVYTWKFLNNFSFEPYFKADAVVSGSDLYYYNNVTYGLGIRIRPFLSGYIFGEDFQVLKKLKLFVEVLSVSYLKERGEVDHDFRFGFDFNFGR